MYDISPEELKDYKAYTIVDIRDSMSYAYGHLPDAISVPQAELSTYIDEWKDAGKILIYCKRDVTACVVTWFNPQAIIDGTMMLGAFRASLPSGGDLPFICGFGSASVIWFLTLSTIVSLLGSKFNEKALNIINKVCGGVIIFYGCKLIWNFVQLMGWVK